jgi:hypothetical protein
MSGTRTSRLPELLAFVHQNGTVNSLDVQTGLHWDRREADKFLSNAKGAGYLEFSGDRVPGVLRQYVLSALGRKKVFGDPNIGANESVLGKKAAAMILSEPAGLASDELAVRLGVGSFEVEKALAQCKQYFATCKVFRNGDDFIHYRESASGKVGSDWQQGKQIGASVPAKGAHWAFAPAVAPALETLNAAAVERTMEVKHFPAPPPMAEAEAEPLESVTESSQAEDDDGCEQFFCLYSTGDLLMQRTDGQQVHLTPEETRALFQWLDQLGGTALTRLAAPQEEVKA